jgi:hypothetical protein
VGIMGVCQEYIRNWLLWLFGGFKFFTLLSSLQETGPYEVLVNLSGPCEKKNPDGKGHGKVTT